MQICTKTYFCKIWSHCPKNPLVPLGSSRLTLSSVCLMHIDLSIHLERACSVETVGKIKSVFIYCRFNTSWIRKTGFEIIFLPISKMPLLSINPKCSIYQGILKSMISLCVSYNLYGPMTDTSQSILSFSITGRVWNPLSLVKCVKWNLCAKMKFQILGSILAKKIFMLSKFILLKVTVFGIKKKKTLFYLFCKKLRKLFEPKNKPLPFPGFERLEIKRMYFSYLYF